MKRVNYCRFKTFSLTGVICLSLVSLVTAKTLIDYFLPMPIVKPLRSEKWGCSIVGKRDIYNGIEDTTMKSFCYWDGPIIKGPDGKYHMFASRWGESGGHWSWLSSVGIHAISDSIMGPYTDKGLTWPGNQAGKGHNLTILELKDGTYASVVSDTRPGDFFTAPSLDGPWTFAGSIKINANGFTVPQIANLSIIIRPDDGSYMIVARNGQIMISSSNLTGPYVIQGNSVYNEVNLPNLEDPVLWYSGGLYHIVVNSWSERKAFHLISKDGIKNWTNEGLAFDPTSNFLRYTDGTVNKWNKIERPGVVIENGHVTHFTFAVIDVPKDQDVGNDNHGSKVIVVPFDGLSFDGITIPAHRDTIYNGKFENGTAGWNQNVWEGSATGTVENGEYKIMISSLGTENHQIQLVQAGLILEQGKFYKVLFDAYASANRSLEVTVEMAEDPWTKYIQALKTFDLTTTKTPYSFTFKMEQPTDSSGRLGFNFGASTETLFLDNVAIQQIDGTSLKPVMKPNILSSTYEFRTEIVNNRLKISSLSGNRNRFNVSVFKPNGQMLTYLRNSSVIVSEPLSSKGIYIIYINYNGHIEIKKVSFF